MNLYNFVLCAKSKLNAASFFQFLFDQIICYQDIYGSEQNQATFHYCILTPYHGQCFGSHFFSILSEKACREFPEKYIFQIIYFQNKSDTNFHLKIRRNYK